MRAIYDGKIVPLLAQDSISSVIQVDKAVQTVLNSQIAVIESNEDDSLVTTLPPGPTPPTIDPKRVSRSRRHLITGARAKKIAEPSVRRVASRTK